MAEQLDAASFAGHEGSTFTVHVGDDTVDLELIEITEHDYPHQESFSVLFRGPEETLLEHDTYRVEHEELGSHELCLGPVVTGETDDETQHFEAAFSRLKEVDE